jgi:hypothetical protein
MSPSLIDPDGGDPRANVFDEIFGRPAARAGVPVRYLGTTPRPARDAEHVKIGGAWWLSVEACADPCRVRGRHAVPSRILGRLASLSEAGLELDYLRVLHEVPDAGWAPSHPLPDLVPGSPIHRQVDRALVLHTRDAVRIAAMAARASSGIAARLLRASVVVGATPVALLGDPVLLGGREVSHGQVAWVELARWRWS